MNGYFKSKMKPITIESSLILELGNREKVDKFTRKTENKRHFNKTQNNKRVRTNIVREIMDS